MLAETCQEAEHMQTCHWGHLVKRDGNDALQMLSKVRWLTSGTGSHVTKHVDGMGAATPTAHAYMQNVLLLCVEIECMLVCGQF